MPTAKTSGGRGGEVSVAGQGGRVEPNPKQTTSEPAAVGCFDGTHGRTAPNHPGGAKARGSREKKTGRGNGKGGRGNRGPGPAGGRDREPLGRGASDTPLPQLVASLPGINGASAYGPLERVTPCRRKILGTSTSPRVRTARQPPQSAMGRPAAPPGRARHRPADQPPRQTREGMHPRSLQSAARQAVRHEAQPPA